MSVTKHKLYYVSILILVSILLFFIYKNFSFDNSLRVIFLDVGQGDAALIVTPNGRTALIDAGRYGGLGKSISNYTPSSRRDINLAIATHMDADHVGGFSSIIDEYDIDIFIHSGFPDDSLLTRNLIQKVNNSEIKTKAALAGDRIVLDRGVYIDILSPYSGIDFESKNEHSIVVRLSYGESSFLFMGDASIFNEQEIMNVYGTEIIDSDVLKVGHHGSKTSTSKSFIEMVSPRYGIISASCDNSFGHPHQSVLNTLFERGVKISSTCEEGDIEFIINNHGLIKR